MRSAILRPSTVALFLAVTGLFVLGDRAEVRAQSALCPTQTPLPPNQPGIGISLQGGLCTNAGSGRGGPPTGAFSGAALATQALTELTQTTTQETVRSTQSGIADRREQRNSGAVQRGFHAWTEAASAFRLGYRKRCQSSPPAHQKNTF